MALINCPECNKEISDKSECCINCGYKLPKKDPMFQGVYCPSCLESNIKINIDNCPYCNIKFKDSIYGTSKECSDYTKNHPELKESPEFSIEAYNKRINYVPVEYGNSSSSNGIKCPTCQSTNISKIGTAERVGSVAMLGIFSKKINKSFKCKSCGYTW